jgi:magnesium-transporting ATPase (P-type)
MGAQAVVSGAAGQRRSLAAKCLSRFGNPLVLLLLAPSALSFATDDATSTAVISVIILLAAMLVCYLLLVQFTKRAFVRRINHGR